MTSMGEGDSDAALIRASWEKGEYFAILFDRYFPFIFKFCARRIGTFRAEDLASETFRRAFEHRRNYDLSHINARPWLVTIALNAMRDGLRSDVREKKAYGRIVRESCDQHRDIDDLAISSVDAKRSLASVVGLFGDIPTDELETLLLYVWDELSYAETALVLNVPIGTVRSRLHRLRTRFSSLDPLRESKESSVRTATSGGQYGI